ncbi:hypothetical protein F4780DRAFT_232486 [Xylariomycetidae sp. FL0641]|nr:hypothetical protein F4780DRAFT_232486 [Xylariomycetidae sp. FL0641]
MGIKGIYKEIGPGKRISLTKLAVEKLEETGRPLRIAIDISIWQFQVQAARGGSNPAVRTLFYRLLRLLCLSIQPIFVFDGPNKPVFKRNKRSGRGDGVATAMAKRMIRLFGFPVHDAPGEAEAECALLQRSGIVDAVLSEDVDTIMFGCTRTLRNYSAEGTRGSKTPTHVSMYDTEAISQSNPGLDREGMVLVALMSGGDYLPEGIPGAGVKLACEAAKAGFGKSLCRIKRSDASELASWREWLIYELRHNESGFFRTRHKALNVPDSFPDMDILRYYTHPVVSPASTLDRLKQQTWHRPIDILGLREFCYETFDWAYRVGAIKFIRVLAPGLLVRKLIQRSEQPNTSSQDLETIGNEESGLVKAIKSKRAHFSTDATPELRVSFIPTDIVGYDFQDEPDEVIDYGRDGLALNSDDEAEAILDEEEAGATAKVGSRKPFSPTEPDLLWVPESLAKLGIPLMVEDWEEAQRSKAAGRSRAKVPSKAKPKASGMSSGALDKFTKVTKANTRPAATKKVSSDPPSLPSPGPAHEALGGLPAPSSQRLASIFASCPNTQRAKAQKSSSKLPKKPSSKSSRNAAAAANGSKAKLDAEVNPWTIAGSQVSPKVTRTKTTKVTKSTSTSATSNKSSSFASTQVSEAILISSSPPASPAAEPQQPPPPANTTTRQTLAKSNSLLFSSPSPSPAAYKRRSITPPPAARPDPFDGSNSRPPLLPRQDPSPSPSSAGRKSRKLARTEAVAGSSRRSRSPSPLPLDSDVDIASDESPVASDDDDDLPPLSRLVGRRLGAAISTETPKPRGAGRSPRMTKLYLPRASLPGFAREVEVRADEAAAALAAFEEEEEEAGKGGRGGRGRGRGVRGFRLSEVEVIDLTGD